MTTRGRAIALGVGAFLLGGLVIGSIAGAAGGFGTAAAIERGAWVGPFIFFGFFKVLVTVLFIMLLFRLMAFGFGWRRHGRMGYEGMDPRSRLEAWHEKAHAAESVPDPDTTGPDTTGPSDTADQNDDGEDGSGR